MTLIISIDGNIGSGKSIILKNLKDQFINKNNIIFLEDPVNEYIKIKDDTQNILEIFYKDSVKYAFPFQMMTLITRFHIINKIIKNNPNTIIILKRSLYTDKYIFAKMLFETNKMNTFEYQIYNKWFDEFTQNPIEYKYIYILSDPIYCFERIKERNRYSEHRITIDYLKLCNDYHDQMFNNISSNLIVNIDGNNLNSLENKKTINKIKFFILNQDIKQYIIQDTITYFLLQISIFCIFYFYIKLKKN